MKRNISNLMSIMLIIAAISGCKGASNHEIANNAANPTNDGTTTAVSATDLTSTQGDKEISKIRDFNIDDM
ncbi:hypothetical protein [Gorillibacterium massiliense]|uniref:hypothetical protein n=1 Tax=Gorillibacterium massiliense TaxID=1280390 RepID=UPI000593A5C9|nr:hypothetical protein [Gorillibacterium massiliense]